MEIDKNALLESFLTETVEHLDNVRENLFQLKENPNSKEIINNLLREFHTIKGTSRMMGFKVMEKLAHLIEDVLKSQIEEKIVFTVSHIQLIFLASDAFVTCIEKIKNENNDVIPIEVFVSSLENAANGFDFSIEKLLEYTNVIDSVGDLEESLEQVTSLSEVKYIKIKIDKINELIRSFDNLIIKEFKFKHEIDMLKNLEERTGNVEIRKIRMMFEEDFEQLEETVFETQNSVFDLRMLPLDLVLNPIKRTIELESIESGKNISIDIPSTDIYLDKLILEPLNDVLLHIVRNAIDHGIEPEERRKELGKSETGKISVEAKTISNKIIITVSDDGCGIDFEKIREKAIQLNPQRKNEIEAMSEKQMSAFLYMPGFSTIDTVNAMSGRGMGLDIVKNYIEKIKGKIHFTSEVDKGTTFYLTLPLSLATQQGLFVLSDKMKLLIPSNYIVEIVHVKSSDYIILQEKTLLRVRDQVIPVFGLPTLTGLSKTYSSSRRSEYDNVLIVEYLERKVGIVVSEVFSTESVVVKPLPKIFENFEAVQGVVFDENYDLVPIIHIPYVLEKFNRLVNYDVKKFMVKTKPKKYKILVVDDSLTTREIEKTILETEGFVVETAADGIEALEKMKQIHFDGILTDIAMPKMEGTVLIENIRRIEGYENVPIVIVAANSDSGIKKLYDSIGIQGYIIKSKFERGELIDKFKELLDV